MVDHKPKSIAEVPLSQEELEVLVGLPAGNAFKIMVVDDDPDIRNLLSDALTRDLPYLVESAANGIEASIRLGTFKPDLLILDIFMPEMDGLELCRVIKADPELNQIKVIIITGHPDHPKLNQLAELGYTDIFAKPFNLKKFLKTVDTRLQTS